MVVTSAQSSAETVSLLPTVDTTSVSRGTYLDRPSAVKLSAAQVGPAISALSVVPPVITPVVNLALVRERIITPYRAEVFESELRRFRLLHLFPDLPDNIRTGFRIGVFPTLPYSCTPPNHKTGLAHMPFITAYIDEQVSLSRMSGPFSQLQLESILGCFFMSSPLSVVTKAGQPEKLRLVQNCSFPSFRGLSVNDFIDSDDYPTTWGTAAKVAQIVSICYPLCPAFASIPISAGPCIS